MKKMKFIPTGFPFELVNEVKEKTTNAMRMQFPSTFPFKQMANNENTAHTAQIDAEFNTNIKIET